jgi:hypothetical protein
VEETRGSEMGQWKSLVGRDGGGQKSPRRREEVGGRAKWKGGGRGRRTEEPRGREEVGGRANWKRGGRGRRTEEPRGRGRRTEEPRGREGGGQNSRDPRAACYHSARCAARQCCVMTGTILREICQIRDPS